jgi:hypothetical protein
LTFAAGAAVAAGLAAGTSVGALAPVPVVACAGVVAADWGAVVWGAVVSDDPQATNRKRHSNKGVSR